MFSQYSTFLDVWLHEPNHCERKSQYASQYASKCFFCSIFCIEALMKEWIEVMKSHNQAPSFHQAPLHLLNRYRYTLSFASTYNLYTRENPATTTSQTWSSTCKIPHEFVVFQIHMFIAWWTYTWKCMRNILVMITFSPYTNTTQGFFAWR